MGLHVFPPAPVLPLPIAQASTPPASNLLVILEGNGGNSAYHAGVMQFLSTLPNTNLVGFVGTSGGAKTSAMAAIGLMRGGMDGLADYTTTYWNNVGREGDSCVIGINPLYNMFAAANMLTNSRPETLAKTLSKLDRSVIADDADFDELRASGIYLGMNAVESETKKDIYFGINHVNHATLMATAALVPAFPEVMIPEIRDPRTGDIVFAGGACRDGGLGGENPIGSRALIDFERHRPDLVGRYDVLVVSLGTSSDEASGDNTSRLDERKKTTLKSIDDIRRMMALRGNKVHVLHADMTSYSNWRPMQSSALYASTEKVNKLSALGNEQAQEHLSRLLGAIQSQHAVPASLVPRHQ